MHFLFLLFECFVCDDFFAQWAIIVVFEPIFNAVFMKVVLFIAWKGHYFRLFCEVHQANCALFESLVLLRIEFRLVEILDKLWSSWYPIGSLCSSHCEEENRYQEAKDYAVAQTSGHLVVTNDQNQEEYQSETVAAIIRVYLLEIHKVAIEKPSCRKS